MLCTLLMVALCVPRQGERIMECWRNTLPGKSTVKNCYAVSKIKYQISPGGWCSIEIPAGTPAGFTSECKLPMICLQCGVMFWVLWHIWNGHKERESGQDQSVEAAWAAEPPVQLHEVMIMFHCSLALDFHILCLTADVFDRARKMLRKFSTTFSEDKLVPELPQLNTSALNRISYSCY